MALFGPASDDGTTTPLWRQQHFLDLFDCAEFLPSALGTDAAHSHGGLGKALGLAAQRRSRHLESTDSSSHCCWPSCAETRAR